MPTVELGEKGTALLYEIVDRMRRAQEEAPTLRDSLAMSIMGTIVSHGNLAFTDSPMSDEGIQQRARAAYRYADAMLEARREDVF